MRPKDTELLDEIYKEYPFISKEDVSNFEKVLKGFNPNTTCPFAIFTYLHTDTSSNITYHIMSVTEEYFLIAIICLALGYYVYHIKSYNKDKANELEFYERRYIECDFIMAGDIQKLINSVDYWRDEIDLVGEYIGI